jgi:hypothetical protein
MTFGRDERDVPEGRRRRPRWLTFLTVLMLLVGGRMFFSSVTDLHRLINGQPEILTLDGGLDPQQEALLRGQIVLINALSKHRPVSLAIHAVARLVLGLVYLFAVAAVFSSDPRGRRAGILAAWAGMVVSAGNAVFLLWVVGRMVPWLLPILGTAYAEDAVRAGRSVPGADVVALQARLFLVDVPMVVTGMGVAFSLLLLLYFRGRRMRLFYNHPR